MKNKINIIAFIFLLTLTGCDNTVSVSGASSISSDPSISSVSSVSSISADTGDLSSLPSYYGDYHQYESLSGETLKTKLYSIVSAGTKSVSYAELWNSFRTTDDRDDGTVWDMYGDYHFIFGTDQAGNYSKPGDVYNREHSVPKSWFKENAPMVTDLWHIYPTDGQINNTRSNYMFGEVDDSVALDPDKVGNPVGNREGNEIGKIDSKWIYSGISAGTTVFEPYEIYKGDFARTYFMMATRYQNVIGNWNPGNSFDISTNSGSFPSLTQYSINLFLTWAKEDPVSQKEIDRNNAVYKIQNNRNPFIDYPGFADLIWGSLYTVS